MHTFNTHACTYFLENNHNQRGVCFGECMSSRMKIQYGNQVERAFPVVANRTKGQTDSSLFNSLTSSLSVSQKGDTKMAAYEKTSDGRPSLNGPLACLIIPFQVCLPKTCKNVHLMN